MADKNSSGKKLGKDADEAFHISITKAYDYGWRFNKIVLNNSIIRDFDTFITLFYLQPFVFNWDRRDDSILMLKIENLITCVQFAEDLAAISLSIMEDMQIHKKLVSYRVKDIINFYEDIQKTKLSYSDIFKILGYPMVIKKQSKLKEDLDDSTKKALHNFQKIAPYFIEKQKIYNSIKHGFRCFSVKSRIEEDEKGNKVKDKWKKGLMIFDQSISDKTFSSIDEDEINNELTSQISLIIYGLFSTIMPNQMFKIYEMGAFGDYRTEPIIYPSLPSR